MVVVKLDTPQLRFNTLYQIVEGKKGLVSEVRESKALLEVNKRKRENPPIPLSNLFLDFLDE